MKTLTIIVPCFNEEETLPLYREALFPVCQKLVQRGIYPSCLFVDDGSKDQTHHILEAFAQSKDTKEYVEMNYLRFTRNFGKEAALFAGLEHSTGDYVVVMDADLQDPPELLLLMLDKIEEGYESVATYRQDRIGEPKIRSFFARQFYRILNPMVDVEIVDGARDYRMMTRCMVDAICLMSERNRFSKGIFAWTGFETYYLPYENRVRAAGETKWSIWTLFKYAIEGIVSFTTVPLRIASILGLFISVFSFSFTVFIVFRKVLFGDPVAGWVSMMSVLLLGIGLQMFCLGILGEYLARTYIEVKKRPLYLLKEVSKQSNDTKK